MVERTHSHLRLASSPIPRRTRGRPSLCTDETLDLICFFIREEGLSDSAAALRAGISAASLSRWKQEHAELEVELSLARGEFRSARLDLIKAAAADEDRGGWRAAAWLLERVFPADYAPRATERQAFSLHETFAETAFEEQPASLAHAHLLEEHRTTHPEDFDEDGLYAPAFLESDPEPPLAPLPVDAPLCEENTSLYDAGPAAPAVCPATSVSAPALAPAAAPAPPAPVLQNLQNSSASPIPTVARPGPDACLLSRRLPGAYAFSTQL